MTVAVSVAQFFDFCISKLSYCIAKNTTLKCDGDFAFLYPLVSSVSDHVKNLQAILPCGKVMAGDGEIDGYAVDWGKDHRTEALCFAFPGTKGEVVEIVRYCAENGLSVIPQGGNTGLVGGTTIDAKDTGVIVNLERLNKVIELDRFGLTMTVEAGCILQNIQMRAEQDGLLFPLSFGAEGSAQIGGVIATNAGGHSVLRYGMARTLILGLEVVLADGSVCTLGGALRKDNRAPDLSHLFAGSEGAFGIVTQATLALVPATPFRETAVLIPRDLDVVPELAFLARTHCADLLSAFELVPADAVDLAKGHSASAGWAPMEPGSYAVLMQLSASADIGLRTLLERFWEHCAEHDLLVDGSIAETVAHRAAFWQTREAMVEAQAAHGRHVRTDIAVRITQIPEFIVRAEAAVGAVAPDWRCIAYGHVGDGNIHFNVLPPQGVSDAQFDAISRDIHDVLDRVTADFEGSTSAEHGVGRKRQNALHENFDAKRLELLQELKWVLDPSDRLNPGCMVRPKPPAHVARG